MGVYRRRGSRVGSHRGATNSRGLRGGGVWATRGDSRMEATRGGPKQITCKLSSSLFQIQILSVSFIIFFCSQKINTLFLKTTPVFKTNVVIYITQVLEITFM